MIQLLVEYAYTSEIHITKDNVQSLLSAANLLEVSGQSQTRVLKHQKQHSESGVSPPSSPQNWIFCQEQGPMQKFHKQDAPFNKTRFSHPQVLPVRDACCQFMERHMDESNCLGIHCFAEAHACKELQVRTRIAQTRLLLLWFTLVA